VRTEQQNKFIIKAEFNKETRKRKSRAKESVAIQLLHNFDDEIVEQEA
jgi:hypothetical protein